MRMYRDHTRHRTCLCVTLDSTPLYFLYRVCRQSRLDLCDGSVAILRALILDANRTSLHGTVAGVSTRPKDRETHAFLPLDIA